MVRDVLNPERNYSSLSVKDLLEARDHYHWHLTHMKNVVGTAVGLYYIRTADPWPTRERPDRLIARDQARGPPTPRRTTPAPTPPRPPRTFDNSEIRDYSWPCVVVLVDQWGDPPGTPNSTRELKAEDFVPQTLYLPDGRTVPVCVVKVDPTEVDTELLPRWTWPKSHVGGGFPLISSTQGRDHVASVGTLVTDGHTTYALTSQHVAGPAGHPVSTILGGRRTEVGHSVDKQLTRRPFVEVYPEYVGRRTFLTLDAALVEVNDVGEWSSQIYGLPPSGELADLSEHNISTRLIDTEVEAYGAASGHLRGKVAGLFYRSRSRGGYDDVSDFLIAPLARLPRVAPGRLGHGVAPGRAEEGRPAAAGAAVGRPAVRQRRRVRAQLRARLEPHHRAAAARRRAGHRPQHARPAVLGKDRSLLDREPRLRRGHPGTAGHAHEGERRPGQLRRGRPQREGDQQRHHRSQEGQGVRPARRRARPGLEEPALGHARRPRPRWQQS